MQTSSVPRIVCWRDFFLMMFSTLSFVCLFFKVAVATCIYFWSSVYSIGLHVRLCLTNILALSLWFSQYNSVVSPTLFFLLRIALTMLVLLCFPVSFKINFPECCEECNWNFDGDCSESVGYFGQHGHFHSVNSTNPQTQKAVPSSVFFTFFFNVFKLSSQSSFSSPISFISIYVWGYIKPDIFLNFFSLNLPLV